MVQIILLGNVVFHTFHLLNLLTSQAVMIRPNLTDDVLRSLSFINCYSSYLFFISWIFNHVILKLYSEVFFIPCLFIKVNSVNFKVLYMFEHGYHLISKCSGISEENIKL